MIVVNNSHDLWRYRILGKFGVVSLNTWRIGDQAARR
jgi:hypothetical protein